MTDEAEIMHELDGGDSNDIAPEIVGGDDAANIPRDVKASWTWGSSARATLTSNAQSTSAQLAQVSLPEPAVCTLYFQANVIRDTTAIGAVRVFQLNLTEGVGRVAVPRNIVFLLQPAVNAPLEFTLPFVPMHALQVNFTIQGQNIGIGEEIEVECYLLVAPITRIPMPPVQPLKLGMALPGEADALDDEMHDELEAEAPTVQEILTAAQPLQEPPELQAPEDDAYRLWVRGVIGKLARRYGRKPTRPELEAAIARIKAREQGGG